MKAGELCVSLQIFLMTAGGLCVFLPKFFGEAGGLCVSFQIFFVAAVGFVIFMEYNGVMEKTQYFAFKTEFPISCDWKR